MKKSADLNTRRPRPLPLPAHIFDLNLSQPLSGASALHAETLETASFADRGPQNWPVQMAQRVRKLVRRR